MPITTQQLIALPTLAPGSSDSASVKILQQWLVENNFMTQADMNTGPGIYGPKTKAAVAAWQAKAGFDTAGNPGYFGPLSKTYLQSTIKAPAAPTADAIDSLGKQYVSQLSTMPPKEFLERAAKYLKANPGAALPNGNTLSAWEAGQTAAEQPVPPAEYKNETPYKNLSPDAKDFIDTAYQAYKSGSEDDIAKWKNAVDIATKMAEPYFKGLLRLAKGEFESQIAFEQGDLERQAEVIKRTRDQIAQDVAAGKSFLTLEQQAEIAQETRKYDEDLLSIADQAAEKGLTFAAGYRSRALAEERRGTQFENVVQSSQRKYNFQLKELELRASRGDTDAQKKLEALKAGGEFQLEKIGRSAESVLGTTNLPGTPGYVPAGGILGDIEQKRKESILAGASIFKELGTNIFG